MRLLADESCDFRVVRALRSAGHDVLAIAEIEPGATDSRVLELAVAEGRPLLTEDRDFGQLVLAAEMDASPGVVLLRCPEASRSRLPGQIVKLVERLGTDLKRSFVVWSPARIRVRRFD